MEGTLTHSLANLPLTHRVEGTLTLTSALTHTVEGTLTPTLFLSQTQWRNSLSLALFLSHPHILILLHTVEDALTH